jgi:C_GCAxxG_C_C family probable redox protein
MTIPAPDSGSQRTPSLAEQTELRAAALYEQRYWCGESVLKAVNEAYGEPMPAEFVRLASGLCAGFGGSRTTCGALAGAVMAAGLLTGRRSNDDPWEPVWDFAGELQRRFVADEGTDECGVIVERIGGMEDPRRWLHCTGLTGRCARWVVEIAEERGL